MEPTQALQQNSHANCGFFGSAANLARAGCWALSFGQQSASVGRGERERQGLHAGGRPLRR
jgi:hypothetical protein